MILSLFAKTGTWCETATLIFTLNGVVKIPPELKREGEKLRRKFLALAAPWPGGSFPGDS